jgi:lipid-binding SYLF domain-containing protein
MRAVQTLAIASVIGAGALLTGCSATGLTQDAYAITQAECQATITHLSKTEAEFDGLVQSSHAWAVFPGEFNGLWYLLGGAGSDGLIYDKGGDVTGYSRHARVNIGIGGYGSYNDFVVFFPDEASLQSFKDGSWSFGGEVAGALFGLGASGQALFTKDVTIVSDPRAGWGLAAYFTIDNFSYNDIEAALSN